MIIRSAQRKGRDEVLKPSAMKRAVARDIEKNISSIGRAALRTLKTKPGLAQREGRDEVPEPSAQRLSSIDRAALQTPKTKLFLAQGKERDEVPEPSAQRLSSIDRAALQTPKTNLFLAQGKERDEVPEPSAQPSPPVILSQENQKTLQYRPIVRRPSWDAQAMASQMASNVQSRALHLLRALHREASYLPDPASREFVRLQIRNRFYRNRNRPTPNFKAVATQEHKGQEKKVNRTISLLKEGRKELQLLKRANAGALSPLARVLEQTYGRRGKRKHDLLRDLEPSYSFQTNVDLRLAKALDAKFNNSSNKKHNKKHNKNDSNKGNNDPGTIAKLPLLSDKFIALVKSQMHQQQDHFKKLLPKSTAPKIPDTNKWGRRMPVGRVRNISKKWYAETLSRLMPPLPEAEWKHLAELAVGKVRWAGQPKKRRARTYSWETQDQIDENISWSRPETEAQRESIERGRAREAHDISHRYMRRMWARVFAQCPLMKWDVERAKWDVKWGKVDEVKEVVLSVDQPDFLLSAFEGDDKKS